MTTSRRSFLQLALAGGASVPTLHLMSGIASAASSSDPIVIGHQADLTGGISSWGYWLDKSAKAAVDHINANGGIAGREIKYVVEDSESNPPSGARKFRSLVQRSKADFVIGAVQSGVNLATCPIAKELKTLYIPNGMAEEMTGSAGNRYVFRTGSDTYSQAAAGAKWAAEQLGKTWTFVFADYGWGWSHFNEHKKVLESIGATVNPPIAVPLDAKDMLPYLAKIPDNTEVLYSLFFGSQSVAFYTQANSMGVNKRTKLYSVVCGHEAISPADLGGASEGAHLLEYLPRQLKHQDTEYNRKIRELMKVDPVNGQEEGSSRIIAGSHYWATWEAVFFIKEAVEKSGWKTKKDTPEVILALEGMSVEESLAHPQGAKTIRAQDHKAIIDFKMSKVQDGKIEMLHAIPAKDIVQFFPPRVDFTQEKV
ncbi:ABC transporter substrate-binding protein [Methylopila henanensis]|uniref:ABC transporter substrate-binding protein n=1 Tax=Methylopila henanensis TaxID=873516 RepID=A0ABW4K6Q6_9HYPH